MKPNFIKLGHKPRGMMNKTEIRELRRKLELTQRELADRLKVEAITVSRWERGQCKPSFQAQRQLNRLAKKG